MSEEQQLFKVTIDNITIEVPPGTTILNAARKIGERSSAACNVLLQQTGRKWW